MTEGWLDFERPIAEAEEEIEELQAIGGFTDQIAKLKVQSEKLKQKIYSNLTPWQQIMIARHPRRPHTLDLIERMTTDFVEVHGDRLFGDDPAMVAGFGRIDGLSAAIIGQEKGRDTRERLKRNFGMPHPDGYRKALRVMQTAARFNLPILTLVDVSGAYPGVGAEERGVAEAIARNLREMAVLPVPVVVVVTGEGGSGGALAIAVGNRVMSMEHSIYSVISPEAFSSIIWRDGSRAEEAATLLKFTSKDLLAFRILDDVIPEPPGCAHSDWDATAANIKQTVLRVFAELGKLTTEELVSQRIERFRSIGVYASV